SGFSFTVAAPSIPLTFVSNSAVVYPDRVLVTATFWNGTGQAATITSRGLVSGAVTAYVTGGTCVPGSSLASGASCTVVIYAERGCVGYTVAATVRTAGVVAYGGAYSVPTVGICE
ncbi:MAG TPA: hypothetical protein VFB61_11700, partial [Gemmatimonadales bacterium]|nr:hypothetical protein [Gemmatimonadales bacterium]